MHFPSLLYILITAWLTCTPSLAAPTNQCTSSQRIAGAKQIPHAYNLKKLGKSAAAFEKVPFAHGCNVILNANGLPGIKVANTAASTRQFALETRQEFSKVTGQYTDFNNGTTIIATNVTFGAAHTLKIPVTFSANVFLTYDLASCEINKVQAYATIPSKVLGQMINLPTLGLPLA